MAVKIEKSGNNIQMIMHFGFNLILSLYAVYAVPHATKAPKQALESSAVTNAIRFNYVMYMVYGLAATVFQVVTRFLFPHVRHGAHSLTEPDPILLRSPTSSRPCRRRSMRASPSTGGARPWLGSRAL